MAYSEEILVQLSNKYRELSFTENELLLKLMAFQQQLKNHKAKEYLMQGAARRLKTIFRCVDKIFSIFPPDREERLSQEKLTDIDINLHAFLINISGIFDNLGWVFVYENDLLGKPRDGKISRNGVGLFCKETQEHLTKKLNDYLTTDPINTWYTTYSKDYRDSLAHRIPLYVPPFLLSDDEAKEYNSIEEQKFKLDYSKQDDRDLYDDLQERQEQLGRISHFLSHSLEEGCRPVYFHAQVLADLTTIEKVVDKFISHFR